MFLASFVRQWVLGSLGLRQSTHSRLFDQGDYGRHRGARSVPRYFGYPVRTRGAQRSPDSILVYPTDSRERQKEQAKLDKERGTVREVKKKKQFVEAHFDDCGEDLGLFGPGHR